MLLGKTIYLELVYKYLFLYLNTYLTGVFVFVFEDYRVFVFVIKCNSMYLTPSLAESTPIN